LLIGGRYRLEDRIAAGAVGQVWRATDLVLRRPVAVKLLRSGYTEDPDTLVRFRSEAQLAGSLTHPGIAQIYDYGEDDSPYLVMELVDGPSLAGILDNGPLDPVRTADVIAQAAAGLEAAHRAGLIHRDIKPENLLLGSGRNVKITDFGIAHATGSAPLTGSGVVMGTAAYLAPERAMGAPGTPASDLYSLGIVAYECLSGTVPYDGTRAEIVAGHMQRQLPTLPVAVPSALVNLIAVMTDKNPAKRPGSAALVAEHAAKLRDAMAAGRPGDRSVSRLVSARPFARKTETPRRRAFMAGAAATAVAAGLGGWLVPALLTAPGTHPGAQASSARPSGSTTGPAVATVQVDAWALVGRQVGVVAERLRANGLHPLVEWTYGKRPTGIVVQVLPTGPVTKGSTIMVLASYRSAIPPGPTASATLSPPASPHGTTPNPGKTQSGKPSASVSGSPSSSTGSTGTGTTPPPVAAGTPSPANPVGSLLNLPGTVLGILLP
jgi:serine/threonine-protein kinase